MNGNTSKYEYGTETCETTATISNPTRTGYTFLNWTVDYGANMSSANFNSSTNVFTYCGNCSSETGIGESNITTLTANWSVNSYQVTCIDVYGSNSSGSELGRSYWYADYNTTVYGSEKGSYTSVGYYYSNYYYTGCSSATVTTSGATVYRYFSRYVAPTSYATVTCIDIESSTGHELRKKFLVSTSRFNSIRFK